MCVCKKHKGLIFSIGSYTQYRGLTHTGGLCNLWFYAQVWSCHQNGVLFARFYGIYISFIYDHQKENMRGYPDKRINRSSVLEVPSSPAESDVITGILDKDLKGYEDKNDMYIYGPE